MTTSTPEASNVAKMSLLNYLVSEVTRGYVLENDEERYTTRREKMYTFMKIPRELEKFMSYGFFHCLDSFLFVFTFLPIRFLTALAKLLLKTPLRLLRLSNSRGNYLFPAEMIDLLKGFIIGLCVYAMSYIDTSMMYHMIKSQSVIKLYLFYNMLEVGDRLFSALGQDTIDALFWTATEPKKGRKREHIGVLAHFLLTIIYVVLHTLLVLLQATTLNVAINASNKALLTIMMSNNFVELKGSVFKKFDKNNLFQVSCSDVRERFHLFALLFIVVVQTMKEYGWREDSFWNLAPDCLLVMGVEFIVDWIKHAFITRFNEVSAEVYKSYTIFLAYDLAQTKQKNAFSDHSDIVSRRMGFIPIPLSVVMIRVLGTAVRSHTQGSFAIISVAYLCLVTFRVLVSIVILGKACDLIETHQESKKSSVSSPVKSSNCNENKNNGEVIKDLNNTTDTSIVSTSIFKEDPTESLKNTSLSTEDMSLLEAKLQTIDPNHRVIPSSPMTPTQVMPGSSAEADNLDPIEEEQSKDMLENHQQHHRWSNNRRSQLLKQHQGELNKVVFSDSRRRPLSCTPPASTSISTSVSIDEDHEENNVKESETSNAKDEDEIIINKESEEVEELTQMRPKALSSPDFMKSYKPAYDAERDWPPIDDDEDELDSSNVSADLEHHEISSVRRGSNELMQRRGSSEDRFRRRKRFDTDRV